MTGQKRKKWTNFRHYSQWSGSDWRQSSVAVRRSSVAQLAKAAGKTINYNQIIVIICVVVVVIVIIGSRRENVQHVSEAVL